MERKAKVAEEIVGLILDCAKRAPTMDEQEITQELLIESGENLA